MKKITALFIAVLMLITCFTCVLAEELPVMIKIDGVTIGTANKSYVLNGDVMLPLREVSQAIGARVTWIEEAMSASVAFNDKNAIIPCYGKNIYINDEAVALRNESSLVNGCIYISASYINLFFDYVTEWNETLRILSVKTNASYLESIKTDDSEDDKGYIDVVATEDAYVKNGSFESQNFGEASGLEFKAETLADYGRIIYLKFNLAEIKNPEFISAQLQLSAYSCEAGARTTPVVFKLYETDSSLWKETEITYANKPQSGNLVGEFSSLFNPIISFDLTEYITEKLKLGVNEISFVLDGDYTQKLRMDFYSKEKKDQLPPRLKITYVEGDSFVKDLPKKENFGDGKDPWEWAKEMLKASKAERTEVSGNGLIKKTTANKYEISSSETTYTNSGTMANDNFASSQTIVVKGDPGTTNTGRVSYIKFDLSEADFQSVDYAYLKLYCTTLDQGEFHKLSLSSVDGEWKASDVTWNKSPQKGSVISTGEAIKTNDWIFLDATEYVKNCVKDNKKTISFALEDKSGVRAVFASAKSPYAPVLSVRTLDNNAQPIEIIKDDPNEYTLKTQAKTDNGTYSTYDTRMFETLSGINISAAKPKHSTYGGRTDMKVEATGSFRIVNKDGRYYFADPDGYLFYSIGMVSVANNGSTRFYQNALKKYKTNENWAEETADWMRNDVYFNTAGAWSNTKLLSNTKNAMAIAVYDSFLVNYASTIGLYTGDTAANNKFTENNTMPVFDPDFVKFADNSASALALQYKDNPRIMGFMSDNELPYDPDMLISYLNLNPEKPVNAYSYAMAWTWLCDYTGKENPDIDDVTDVMKADFLEFVYDRYYFVVDGALEKHIPEKLYLGSRYCFSNYKNKPAMSAAGRYCDVVSINYYYAWTPNSFLMADWYEWAKKPVMITEWYSMAYDSGLPNMGGAGWKVETQKERGKFYHNYTLKLMQNKNCVGFHWFTYQDNDASATAAADPHSSNKGIVNGEFVPWKNLTDEMVKINRQVYDLIDYFDK